MFGNLRYFISITCLSLGALPIVSVSPTNAGAAFLEEANGRGTWVIAASPARLQSLIDQYSNNALSRPVNIRVHCQGTGWIASAYDNETRSFGMACGFSTRAQAVQAAMDQCDQRGGTSCQPTGSGFDDAHLDGL